MAAGWRLGPWETLERLLDGCWPFILVCRWVAAGRAPLDGQCGAAGWSVYGVLAAAAWPLYERCMDLRWLVDGCFTALRWPWGAYGLAVGWPLEGWLVDRLVGWSVGWFVGLLVCWLVGWCEGAPQLYNQKQ